MPRPPERLAANPFACVAALLVAGALLVGSASASATSYLMISDRDLAEQAAVISQVTILASEPAPVGGPPATDYFVQIERVLKGYVAGSECYFDGNPQGTAEVLAHEVGHTLGLAHLDAAGSLMRGEVYDDGRGAAPSPADLQALEPLYGPRTE